MNRPLRTVLAAALALAAGPLAAQTYSQTIFFGDSLTDTGAFRPALIQLVGPNGAVIGRFTTNPDAIWAEYLAGYYGTGAATRNAGGTNYAVGGARTGTDGATQLGAVPSIMTQVQTYLGATGGVADPDALYTVWGGANDLFAISAGAPAGPTLAGAITAQVTAIGMLQAAGARYVLMPNVPDLGLTPAFIIQGQSATGTMLASTYNDALFDALAAAGLRVIPVDVFSLIQEIAADPGTYGFTNVTGTACLPAFTASSLTCSPGSYASPDAADTYAFADGVHPTGAAHEIIADLAISVLEGPRQAAVLPRAAAMTGRARAERVAARLAAPADGEGMHWWADVRGDFQRLDEDDAYDGNGPALTVGVGASSGAMTYGAFAGLGQQDIDWGMDRGGFEQRDATLGGYLGWRGDALWVGGQASWTRLGFDAARKVQLGPATRIHRGSPDGTNLSVGVGGGWTFEAGTLRHGPVLSALSQRIDVDGYDEDNVSSSALGFPDQAFDSLVGSIGWQASVVADAGFRPYLRVTMDREFEEAPEQAFAQSLTIPGSMPYAVPGVAQDDDYSTVGFGARTRLFGLDADIGGTTTLGRGDANEATLYVSFGNAF